VRDAYFVLVFVNAYFLAVAVANVVYLRRATSSPRLKSGPFVSVIVPARNEERAIARCLGSLLAQDYADYEIVVVDDQSTDETARIVAAVQGHDPRVRLVSAAPLPQGWLGKPHALCQGAAAARGEILLLTDADTAHCQESISWTVTNMEDHGADMLSGYLDQQYGSLGESLVVPTMYAMMLLLPLFLIPRTRSPRAAFAIGQYVAIRRDALEAVGGYAAVRDSIVDDMSMAKRMKTFGYRNVFLDARGAARCRLYRGYGDAFHGIERSIYSALGGSPLAVAAIALVVLGLIVGPAFAMLGSVARFETSPTLLTVAVLLFVAQWGLVAWNRKVPLSAFVLYPLVFLNLLTILTASMISTGFRSGVDWKGRTVRVPRDSAPPTAEGPVARARRAR